MNCRRFKVPTDVLKKLESKNIKLIRLFFTDILGTLKSMTVTIRELEAILNEGQGFDGSSIEGFVRIEESDLMAWPDPSTLHIFPWLINSEKAAFMICDIRTPENKPFAGDPRYVLKQMTNKLKKEGYIAYLGPEMEYFYLRDENSTQPLDASGYFDSSSVDERTLARKKAVVALEDMGIEVECSHHEVAPSQHEIDLLYQNALSMADRAMIYRYVVKETARQIGLYATFMPKPIFGENGSGMHTHQSLFTGENNAFFDKKAEYNLSTIARYYMAGLLKHIKEMCLVTNQWVNSYKRLVPDYEAPCYISWGQRNRSSLIRVPRYRAGKEKATRIELRSPDPACNPYLAFAVMLAAGFEGIKNKYPLPPPVEEDIYRMSKKQLKELNIDILPENLQQATDIFERSKLMKATLGKHIFTTLIANKRVEWDKFRLAVTDHEIKNYLPVL